MMSDERCRHGNDCRDGSIYAQTPGDGRHTTRHKATWGITRVAQEVGGRRAKGKWGYKPLLSFLLEGMGEVWRLI